MKVQARRRVQYSFVRASLPRLRLSSLLTRGTLPPGESSPLAGTMPAKMVNFRLAAVRHGANATDPDHAGIWKAAIPPSGTMHGEFENHDPIGLSAGVKIKADCSINWLDPDSRRALLFLDGHLPGRFLDVPHAYLARARKNWERVNTSANR